MHQVWMKPIKISSTDEQRQKAMEFGFICITKYQSFPNWKCNVRVKISWKILSEIISEILFL